MAVGSEELVCYEQLYVDEATWTRFCATCTQLIAFDWVVAPFATSFFEIFGRFPKPRLESLTFRTPHWNWGLYHRHLPVLERGVGATAFNTHSALRGCPALSSLSIQLYQAGDTSEDPARKGVPANPPHLMVNKEIFGDEFCASVATQCRQLELFWMRRVSRGTELNATTQSFTDAALRSLAALPRLTHVVLTSVNITGDGLFALMTEFSHGDWARQRNYKIRVGDQTKSGTVNTTVFYEVVEKFIARLAEHDQLQCASQRVVLRLFNGCNGKIGRGSCVQFLTRVHLLIQTIKRKHPTMRVRIIAVGTVCTPDHKR